MDTSKLLVVVDPQVDFITGILGNEDAEKCVEQIVEKIDNWDGLIYATMDCHDEYNYDDTVEGMEFPKHCVKGTDGWIIEPRIMDVIKRHGAYMVQEKQNSFIDSSLSWYVERHEISTVEFIGYVTDICVISNALMLRGCKPKLDIHVDQSCCVGTSYSNHCRALSVMQSCCIAIDNWE